MKISRAAVIAQPLPYVEHILPIGCRQCLDIGEMPDKAQVIVISLRHTRLLENNLGHPNQIRIGYVSPRQVAFVLHIPILYFKREIQTPETVLLLNETVLCVVPPTICRSAVYRPSPPPRIRQVPARQPFSSSWHVRWSSACHISQWPVRF